MTREEAIADIKNNIKPVVGGKSLDMAIEALNRSTDTVEVVRCKNCKHWHSNTEFCSIWSFQNIAQRTLSDDYCSRAERREE